MKTWTLQEINVVDPAGDASIPTVKQVLYRLMQKGIDLLPLMVEINLWAEKYYDLPPDRKASLIEVKKDKEGFIKRMAKDLKKSIG